MPRINLTTFDLSQLPNAEDDTFEFKSSKTPHNDLKKKLGCAVSGFANSGGGYFVAGVDGNGNADDGFPLKIGRQDLRDWVDQIIHDVEPTPNYDVKLITDAIGRGSIQIDSAVIVVEIYESQIGPHMAPDKHYYIRAGSHTVIAKHFIVEAIWAKRHFSKPRLTHLFRLKPEQEQIIQLGILAMTDAPAINIMITLSPLPQLMEERAELFPLKISIIDNRNPFFFDITTFVEAEERFGKNINLEVEYQDLGNQHYNYKIPLNIVGSLPPVTFNDNNRAKIGQKLESIEKVLSKFITQRENVVKPSILLPKKTEDIFPIIERLIPELLEDMRAMLAHYPLIREFIIMSKFWLYNEDENNMVVKYYYEEHLYLRNKLRILENHGLIYEISYNSVTRFVMSEELAAYLIKDVSG